MAYTTIKKPSDYFNTKLYTGNGSTNAITGVGFQPDFTWNKGRNDAWNHSLVDAVRGVTKVLRTNTTEAEEVRATNLTSFDTDGFTLGSDALVNTNGDTLVSWNWLANGTGVANTDGSISSTVSANTTSGFSIVTYSGNGSAGATIGHGLGSVPKMIIVKDRDNASAWWVYHASLGATKRLRLDGTDAENTNSTLWNDTEPTSSVFSVGTYDQVNGSGINYIAYCFADVQGFSKFGSYTGNGSTDGTFVYTGFKPAFLMVKNAAATGSWILTDTTRSTFNITSHMLQANASAAETTDAYFDILSNGFKVRSTSSYVGHAVNYIYMAFAEEPLVGDNPATAR